eukprot:scaffold199208_cov33-Tisochrysis_lutea.AAC.1
MHAIAAPAILTLSAAPDPPLRSLRLFFRRGIATGIAQRGSDDIETGRIAYDSGGSGARVEASIAAS